MYSTPEEVIDHFYNLLVANQTALGLGFVGYAEERLVPKYPAVQVSAEPLTRELHGTHQFKVDFNLSFWVYHAKLTESHRVRTKNDLLKVTEIRNLLHSDFTLGGMIIFGFVDSENPGVLAQARGDASVGTRMTWTGTNLVTFT